MQALKRIPDMGIIPEHPLYIVNEIPCSIPFAYYVIRLTDHYGDFRGCIYKRYKKEAWRN